MMQIMIVCQNCAADIEKLVMRKQSVEKYENINVRLMNVINLGCFKQPQMIKLEKNRLELDNRLFQTSSLVFAGGHLKV
ncbi:hypothetical protein Tco_1377564 [Tanacetum coccineum]